MPARRSRSGRRNTIVATGGAGQLFAVTTNPVAVDRRRHRARAPGRCGRRRRRVHAVPPDRAPPPVDAPSAAVRGAPRRRRGPARRERPSFMADEHPLADLAPRDVVARAITRRLVDGGPRPPLARRHDDRRLPRPVPDDLARRAQLVGLDPRARLAARRARRALPLRRRRAPTSTARRRSPASGPAARRRAPACTARTGWRRTRCSTGSCSRPGRSTRSSPARTGSSRPASCVRMLARLGSPTGRRLRAVDAVGPSGDRRSPSSSGSMTTGAGVLRDRASLEDVARAPPGRRCRLATPPATSCGTWSRSGGRSSPPRWPARSRAGTHTRLDFPERAERDARSVLPVRPGPSRSVGSRSTSRSRAHDPATSTRPCTAVRDVVARGAGRGPRPARRPHVARGDRRVRDHGRRVRRSQRRRARRHRRARPRRSPRSTRPSGRVARCATATRSRTGTALGDVDGLAAVRARRRAHRAQPPAATARASRR